MKLAFIIMLLPGIIISASAQHNSAPLGDTIKIFPKQKKLQHDSTARYFLINKIQVTGNKRTLESIILRELRLKEGDIVSDNDLDYLIKKDQQKLFNLHLFNTVVIRAVDVDTSVVDLQISLSERWFTFPVPRFQLSDRNFNEWWQNYNHELNRVNYGLKLYQYNLWGRNHTLLLKSQFGFQQDFQLTYKIPYINKKQKEGLVFELEYLDGKNVPDSTIGHKFHFIKSRNVLRTTKAIGLTYTYRNGFYLQHRIKYEYRFSNIADTLRLLNPNYFGDETQHQQFDALTYEVSFDRSDVAAYPLRGYVFLANVQQSGVAIRHDLKKTSAYLRLSGYLDLSKQFLSLQFNIWVLEQRE